jgi:hypothetical protein
LEDALRATPPIAADDVAISWELGASTRCFERAQTEVDVARPSCSAALEAESGASVDTFVDDWPQAASRVKATPAAIKREGVPRSSAIC